MQTNSIKAVWLGVLASLPAWLGGDLTTWKLGIFALALAGYGLVYTPGFELSRRMKWAVGLLVVWPLAGFLPRLYSAAWHEQLTELGVNIGWMWTPQPWVLLEAWLALLIGAYWFLCLFGSKLDLYQTHMALRAFGVSIVAVAVVALSASLNQVELGWWNPLHGIGPFPNRNQTGNLFALSGLMLLALASHESRNNRASFMIWAGGSGVLFLATIVNGSRTGIALFLLGVLAWAVLHLQHARDKRKAIILISVAGLFLAAFLFIGGETLQRLSATVTGIQGGENILSGRWEIWQDSARLFASAPLQGIGIGNYSELFALYREKLISEHRVIHPDSDYVWWVTEIGLVGVALIAWAVWLGLSPYFLGTRRTGRRLRSAAAIASVLFLGHALVDVSAHRMGTLIPALLWLRLTWPAYKEDDFQLPVVGRNAVVAVILMAAIGLWLVLPRFTPVALPNLTYVEKVKAEWQERFQSAPATALKQMNRAAEIAPLDWQVNYCLGLGALLEEEAPDAAWRYWSIARALEPMLADVPYQEGKIWIQRDVARAWYVWREALKRRNMNRSGLLRDMLAEAKDVPELEETLLFLASRMPELRYLVLGQLTSREFQQEKDAYLQELSPENAEHQVIIRYVFQEWAKREGEEVVASYVRQHPEWIKLGWKHLLKEYYQLQQYREAYQMMIQLFPRPTYPKITASEDARREHLRRIVQGSGDLVSAYSFLRYDRDQLSPQKGKEVIQQLQQRENLPAYMNYVIADYLAESREWSAAVRHLEHYGNSLDAF